MGRRDFLRVAARDGLSIPLYVTKPANAARGKLPTVVMVHEDPFMRGGSWEWEAQAQFLASRGYLVLEPEFRGSTGFGFKHYRAGWKQWGQGMVDDVADATRWAIAEGLADPDRIAIGGTNYGGYATLMGLIRYPELYRCGFQWLGVTDINLMFDNAWSNFTNDWLRYGMRQLVADPIADAAMIKRDSPLEQADKLRQPLLMAYGTLDARVPLQHGTELYSAIKRKNADVEWITYPDEGHGWYLEPNRIDFWKRVEAFLERNLKRAE
ncbi:alpha/beta hydrolase family protein [Chitinimonas koreensis]|nr:prolyl oligopeptidase family serine peptidase [Chitinimonas koreensis]QNM94841.1 S9 family peptidase [Chitinimonas koreensis]